MHLFQINGFDGAVNSAKKQAATATAEVDDIRKQLQQLEATTNETIANVSANFKRDEDIKNEIAILNSTLVSKVDTLQARIQEINVSDASLEVGSDLLCKIRLWLLVFPLT